MKPLFFLAFAREEVELSDMPSSYRLYAGGYEGKIVQLEFDSDKAPADRLCVTGQFECGEAPTWLTFSQDGELPQTRCSRCRECQS